LASYRLELTGQAEKSLESIRRGDKRAFRRIVCALDDIEKDPNIGKPLKGALSGRYSLRVADYRIVYVVKRGALLVIVIDMGHRRDIYR